MLSEQALWSLHAMKLLNASKALDSRIRLRSNLFRPTFEGLSDVDIAQGSIAS
jgi:hypothetical protein